MYSPPVRACHNKELTDRERKQKESYDKLKHLIVPSDNVTANKTKKQLLTVCADSAQFAVPRPVSSGSVNNVKLSLPPVRAGITNSGHKYTGPLQTNTKMNANSGFQATARGAAMRCNFQDRDKQIAEDNIRMFNEELHDEDLVVVDSVPSSPNSQTSQTYSNMPTFNEVLHQGNAKNVLAMAKKSHPTAAKQTYSGVGAANGYEPNMMTNTHGFWGQGANFAGAQHERQPFME